MTGCVGNSRFDICVVGGGPAGAIAAHVLAGAGARVALIVRDRPGSAFAVGETVPAQMRPLLKRLGLDCLNADLHLPSAGTMARWGSAAVHFREAILNPYGCGWHLDRRLFERNHCRRGQKRRRLARQLHPDRNGSDADRMAIPDRARRAADRRVVKLRRGLHRRSARLAVEAGARRIIHDKLIAIWGVAEEGRGDADRHIYIELAPDGWLYSAQIPNRRRVVAFFSPMATFATWRA